MCWLCGDHNIYLVYGLRKRDYGNELLGVFYDHDKAWAYAAKEQLDEALLDAWAEGHRVSDADARPSWLGPREEAPK